jgi:glycosyltransferase involved in cell wall biosynthesis
MKVAIIGTRGIPNHYGGFEQFAEYLALGLVNKGHQVIVYNSHNHPYSASEWNGVEIVHCYDPEEKLGTAGQFIYDLNCIRDVRKQKCDIILQLGYTSSSIWGWLMPKGSIITTNMDGLEWKRTKYTSKVRAFILWAEGLGVKFSDYLISDSIGIQEYLKNKYGKDSIFIPYGAEIFDSPKEAILDEYNLSSFSYDLLIARLEPENSIEIILDGVHNAAINRPFLVVGNHNTKYGEYLKSKYKANSRIRFIGGIYNINALNNIRYFSNLYFHGHTVGGTNPSLLEAMASNSLICANDNPFNRYILQHDALYFNTSSEVTFHLENVLKNKPDYIAMMGNNLEKIEGIYKWEIIVDQYLEHFKDILSNYKYI